MQKFISKYATAAHLALMAVAPLVLYPFCTASEIADVLFWLSLFSAMWVFVEPFRRSNEMLHDARERVITSVVRDPLFWLSLVLVIVTGLRWLNDGVAMKYDAEHFRWFMSDPVADFFPGCVPGTGKLPFASMLALTVLLVGCRHALGKLGRLAFFTSVSYFVGLAGIIFVCLGGSGDEKLIQLSRCVTDNASYMGMAFGLYLFASAVAITGAIQAGWKLSAFLLSLAAGGCAIGLFFYGTFFEVSVFVLGALIIALLGIIYSAFESRGAASLQCFLAVVTAAVMTLFFVHALAPSGMVEAKLPFLAAEPKFLPEGFEALRSALSDIASRVWGENRWVGTGLGSFPLDIRFNATESQWLIIKSGQQTALNGWWQLLVERGIVGCVMLALPLGFLIWSYLARAIGSIGSEEVPTVAVVAGPLALAALVALAFVDTSLLRSDVMLAAGSLLALAANSFKQAPKKKKTEDGDK